MAELVARRGKARQARRVLERGLEALPGHAVLRAALEELAARSAQERAGARGWDDLGPCWMFPGDADQDPPLVCAIGAR